jgi:hypothetical protein
MQMLSRFLDTYSPFALTPASLPLSIALIYHYGVKKMLGVYQDLSNEDYHADRTAVSRSGLWQFRQAPAKYWNHYLNPERRERKDTPDMAFGRAFHTYVLEPHLFDTQYFVPDFEVPKVDEKPLKRDLVEQFGGTMGARLYEEAKELELRQKEARDAAINFHAKKAEGKEIITLDQMAKLKDMRASVMSHPQAPAMITGGAIEHSLFWEDPHTGVRCKTRPDIWFENMTVDLKTCKDADERSFIKSVYTYGYSLQSAMNREGIYHTGGNDIKTHAFICVEKEWPHMVAVYYLDQIALDAAHNLFKNTLESFKESLTNNIWKGYETKEISIPAWAL